MPSRSDKTRSRKKLFVLDTTVPLHDSDCIRQFQENDLAVPITVLEELDQFKKGSDTRNYHAREFLRTLDTLSADRLFQEGVPIGKGLGRVSVCPEREFHPDVAQNFSPAKPDHHILNTAFLLSREAPPRAVVLVTKDVNLRMKARSVGLVAEDYTSDHVKDISALYTGSRTLENVPDEVLQGLYRPPYEVPADSLGPFMPFVANEFLVVRNGKRSALATYAASAGVVRRIERQVASKIEPRNAEQTFALNALLDEDISLVSMTGKAGTGKTLLALAASFERKKHHLVERMRGQGPFAHIHLRKGERSSLAELASNLL